jgi:hypothetical protein
MMLFVFSSGISSAVMSSYLIKRTYGKEVTAAIAGTGTEEAELKKNSCRVWNREAN